MNNDQNPKEQDSKYDLERCGYPILDYSSTESHIVVSTRCLHGALTLSTAFFFSVIFIGGDAGLGPIGLAVVISLRDNGIPGTIWGKIILTLIAGGILLLVSSNVPKRSASRQLLGIIGVGCLVVCQLVFLTVTGIPRMTLVTSIPFYLLTLITLCFLCIPQSYRWWNTA